MAHEFIIVGDLPRLELAGGHAHGFHAAGQALLHRLIPFDVRVAPDHHHGIALRGLVLGQISFEDALGLEAVCHLKAQDGIVQLLLDHFVEIVLRAFHAAAEAAIIGHASGKDDACQVLVLGQRPALFIKTPPDTHAPHLGVDAHFIAVEPVAGRIVAAAVTVAGDLVPVVVLKGECLGQLHGRAIADDLIIEQGDEAPFAEIVDLPADLAVRIGRHVLVNAAHQIGDAGNVLDLGIADIEPLLSEFLRTLAFYTTLFGRLLGHCVPVSDFWHQRSV